MKRRELSDTGLASTDDRFVKNFLYFFELKVPPEIGGSDTTFVYPLLLPPESIRMNDPFTTTLTPTVDGTFFVEEYGVFGRPITITGHTGWNPLVTTLTQYNTAANSALRRKEWNVPDRQVHETWRALSGQRNFQFLQDKFRIYGEVKKNPQHALKTQMFFHNPLDEEYWEIVPIDFALVRDRQRPMHYNYAIQFIAIGIADKLTGSSTYTARNATWQRRKFHLSALVVDLTPAWIRELQGFVKTFKQAINTVRELRAAFKRAVRDIEAFVNGVVDVINAATDIVNAVVDVVTFPFELIDQLATDLGNAAAELVSTVLTVPVRIVESIARAVDAVYGIAVSVKQAWDSATTQVAAIPQRPPPRNVRALTDAENATYTRPTQTTTTYQGLLPGDSDRIVADVMLFNAPEMSFNSTTAVTVKAFDTIEKIAHVMLGDAALAPYIIALNRLQPPYISDTGLPGTVRPGTALLIPTNTPRIVRGPNVLGVAPNAAPSARLFGTDFKLKNVGADVFDLELNTEMTDLLLVTGIDNVSQAVLTRVLTVEGESLSDPTLGVERPGLIGNPLVDSEIVQLRMREAVRDDPRVARVTSTAVSTGDTVSVRMEVWPITETSPIVLNEVPAAGVAT